MSVEEVTFKEEGGNVLSFPKLGTQVKTKTGFKVIPLKLFYYQTFFETWCNEHS